MSRTNTRTTLSRRGFLAGALGAGVLAAGVPRIRLALASEPARDHRFVACYFNGGWDVLLGGDPRDPGKQYAAIDLGTDLLAPKYRTPVPVMIGGRETLLGAPMSSLAEHADQLALFRGVNMNTVSHGTAKAYVNTYIQPAGVSERGSSLATAIASASEPADSRILTNMAIGVPSFNTEYPAEFTAIGLQTAPEILGLLQQDPSRFPDELEALLQGAQDASESCISNRYVAPRHSDQLKITRERMRQVLAEDVVQHFDFSSGSASMTALRARYGFDASTAADFPKDPRIAAATTAQLIRTGLASAVTVQLQNGLDAHSDWATDHPPLLEDASKALATLISDLREDDPDMSRTTVVAYSEFARTPRINGRQGRDHWFANSMFVFGGALNSGVYGATREDNLGLATVDLASGLPSDSGVIMRPEDIGATLMAATGGSPLPFRAAPVSAWIKGGGA